MFKNERSSHPRPCNGRSQCETPFRFLSFLLSKYSFCKKSFRHIDHLKISKCSVSLSLICWQVLTALMTCRNILLSVELWTLLYCVSSWLYVYLGGVKLYLEDGQYYQLHDISAKLFSHKFKLIHSSKRHSSYISSCLLLIHVKLFLQMDFWSRKTNLTCGDYRVPE